MTFLSCGYRRWLMYLNICISTLALLSHSTIKSFSDLDMPDNLQFFYDSASRNLFPRFHYWTQHAFTVRCMFTVTRCALWLRFERYIASDIHNARRIRSVHDDSKTRKNDLWKKSLKTNGRKEGGEGRARFYGSRSEIALLALSCWRLWSVPDSSWSRRSSL